jgi:hypothetical protein
MAEQKAHTLTVVSSPTRLGQSSTDIHRLNLTAPLLLALMGHRVRHHNPAQLALVQNLNRIARQNAMCNERDNFPSTIRHHSLSGLCERAAGVCHIVDQNGDLVLDIADQNHAGDFVWSRTLLVDKSKGAVEPVGDGGSSLGAASVGTDDDCVPHVQVALYPPQSTWLCIEVVNRDVEKALDLAGVEIHCDDMVATCGLEHVGHEFCGDGSAGLVFLVLASVGEVGDDGGDASGGSGLASGDDDEEFHDIVVDIAGCSGLDDENCSAQLVGVWCADDESAKGRIWTMLTILISY